MKHLLTSILLLMFISANAENNSKALAIAKRSLSTKRCVLVKQTDAYRIYQNADGVGYSIIGICENGENRLLGYSPSCNWREKEMPQALMSWLDNIQGNAILSTQTISKHSRVDIAPLLTSHWHQTSPYNDLSPVITDGNIKTVAGCVAIAASQVVYYWRKDNPSALLKDTPVYPYGSAPVTVSIPKGTPNYWELIMDSYDKTSSEESRAAVAQLVYAVGTGSYLDFGSSTGGQISVAKNAIFSQYRLLGENAVKANYTQTEWEQLLYNDLVKHYPLMYSGSTSSFDGHAIVLDGYEAATNLFHFNFGWGGSGDGYYTVDDVSGVGGYSIGQGCVYDIHPKNRNIDVKARAISVDAAYSKAKIEFSIINNSTLPIESLYVFDNGSKTPASLDICIAKRDTIINNSGIIVNVVFEIPINGHLNKKTLVLTDRYLYPLHSMSLDLSTAINDINNDEATKSTYNIIGVKMSGSKCGDKGIKIIKTTKGTKKVIGVN